MTNEQKYKTTEERVKEFLSQREVSSIATVVANEFAHWLALEAVEKPEPCPFCHSETEIVSSNNIYQVSCIHCLYLSEGCTNEESAISAHNRVCRAVEAVKKGDMK